MRKVPAIGVLAVLVVAASVSAQQGPAALVIRVDGDVAIAHGADAAGPGAVGEQLFEGDVVVPAAGSRAILINRAGAQQVVTQRTTISASEGEGNADLFARAVATLAQAASTDASMGAPTLDHRSTR